jgi:integrase
MTKALTQLAIENTRPGPARREIPDGKERGLYLVVQPTGGMSWAFRYRIHGRSQKMTVGPYPAVGLAKARAEAARAKVSLADDDDPAAAKRAARAAKSATRSRDDSVEKVFADFISLYAKPNTRDWKGSQRLLKHFAEAWKGRPLPTIGKADVHRVLDGIVARGAPVGANRAFAQLRKMFRWAVSRGLLDRNPCDGIDPPSAEKSRDRVLDTEELRLVWRAAGDLGFPFGPIVRLLVLTGQRRSEVGAMEWREIDLDRATWTIPAARSKNRRQHVVPLSPEAVEIIKALPRFSGSKFVFSPGERAPSGYSNAKTRLDARITALNGGESLEAWTLHDIRRSVASGLAGLGVNLPVIERILNHVSGSFGGVAGVYQKYNFAAEMRAALDRWGRHVKGLASGEMAPKVVLLKKA